MSDAVALEESFVGLDARTALSVGQVRGTPLVACAKAPALLRLGQVPTPTHAADALAVAYATTPAPLRLAG